MYQKWYFLTFELGFGVIFTGDKMKKSPFLWTRWSRYDMTRHNRTRTTKHLMKHLSKWNWKGFPCYRWCWRACNAILNEMILRWNVWFDTSFYRIISCNLDFTACIEWRAQYFDPIKSELTISILTIAVLILQLIWAAYWCQPQVAQCTIVVSHSFCNDETETGKKKQR